MKTVDLMKLKTKTIECSVCGCELLGHEAWVNDDMTDNKLYCHDCATDDCIRIKDLT